MAIQYICNNLQRKTKIRENVSGLNGIDYLEVYDSQDEADPARQTKLYLHFVKSDFDQNLENLIADNIRIEGGSRVKNIRAIEVTFDSSEPDMVEVEVDRYGDFSLYTLRIIKGGGDTSPPDWLDPILSTVEFSFKVSCPSDFDCQQETECPPQTRAEPEIDYLAKDYASFRQLMLDRLANIIPDWQERNPSDVGIAAVEVLAYAGDHLSYFQDAVATEAYLDTARRRVSMRRHARLLDYVMHEGCNSRTWVVLNAGAAAEGYIVPSSIPLFTDGPYPDVTELDLSSPSGSDTITNITIRNFALFAKESLLIEASSQINQGHVGSNQIAPLFLSGESDDEDLEHQYASVKVEENTQFANKNSIIFGDKITIENDAQVANVAYGSELDNKGVITGNTYQSVSFPLLEELPTVPDFTYGSAEIEVEEDESQTLVQGDYDKLEVGHGGHITFSGGVYNFKKWKLEQNARLFFTAPTEIRIAEKLETKNFVRINQGSESETVKPGNVTIYIRGDGDDEDDDEHKDSLVKFGYRNQINATIYGPDVNMIFRDRVQARGTFFARRIATGNQGQFYSYEVNEVTTLPAEIRLCIENLTDGMHVFETMHPVTLYQNHNVIEFYTWGDDDCCLPKGSTKASLKNESNRLVNLQAGDLLLFEEVSGLNGRLEDADIRHRHVVRISKIIQVKDPLFEEENTYVDGGLEEKALRILNIEWALEDALPFPLCLKKVVSNKNNPDSLVDEQTMSVAVSVARGNIVLADHGRTICQESLEPVRVPPVSQRYRPGLIRTGPVFRVPYEDEKARTKQASGLLIQNPRNSIPDIQVDASNNESWIPQRDLLNADRFATEFVMEMEDDDRAYLRFGDNVLGKRPAPGLGFTATYRIGNGTSGNIGAETLKHIYLPAQFKELEKHIQVRNPVAAQGGTNPESIEQVRLYAPQAFRTQKRAVTASDYALMAESHPEVQKAVANQRWTGSWHTVFITIDRTGGREVNADFERKIREYIEPLRMMGHEVEIEAPRQVALDVSFRVCVKSEYLKSKVKEELLEVFSNGNLLDGRAGFFHPDNFTFGQMVYLSRLVETSMQVAGVTWVDPVLFQRWGSQQISDIEKGFISMGRLEIARLDNNPDTPENGKIDFIMDGGL